MAGQSRDGAGPAGRWGRLLPGVDPEHPFARLAVTHLVSVAGDTLVALALAGSLFLGAQPGQDRVGVALYLLFSMAPFAVIGPLIGPAMDRIRGGHRAVIIGTGAGRAVVAAAMISPMATGSLWLFPLAFVMLVMGKAYQVARSAVVPTTVPDDAALVEANAKLQLISALAGLLAGLPGGLLLLAGPPWAVGAAAVVFAVMTAAATRIVPTTVAGSGPGAEEDAELRGPGIRRATIAMGVLRWDVGFVTFLLAFILRQRTLPEPGEVLGATGAAVAAGRQALVAEVAPHSGPPAWHFGVVSALLICGGLVGAWLSPILRRTLGVEQMLALATVTGTVGGIAGVVLGGLPGDALLALLVLLAATVGKQAFDALVQRDAPAANRGRVFGRFETRFQVVWVVGALMGTVIPIHATAGAAVVALVTAVAGAISVAGIRPPSAAAGA